MKQSWPQRMMNRRRQLWGRARQCLAAYEEVLWLSLAFGAAAGLLVVVEQSDVFARDWRTIYRPAVRSGRFITAAGVANPAYLLVLLGPLAKLPALAGYAILMGISIACFRLAAWLSGVNKWLIFPSFPALWMLVYGQLDGLVMLGVALGYWAIQHKKPYAQGAATLLLLLKPQVGAVLALVYLVWQRDRRALVISGLAGIASLFLFGMDWPLIWLRRLLLETALSSEGQGFGGEANSFNDISRFPYGLLAWPLLLLPYPRRAKVPAIISASLLSSPYAGAYSLLSAMALPLPALVYPLLSLPLLGGFGYDWIVLAPVALLLWPVIYYHLRPLWRRNEAPPDRKA